MKLLIHSEPSIVKPFRFVTEILISFHILPYMWLLIYYGIKVNPYQQKGPQDQKNIIDIIF